MDTLRKRIIRHTICCAFIFFFFLLIHLNTVRAANACTSTGTGNWSVAGTWTSCNGGIPTSVDSVTILTGHTVTVDTVAVAASVTLNGRTTVGSNGITISGGQSLTVSGAVIILGPTINAATSLLDVGSGSLTAASITINSGTTSKIGKLSVSTGTVTITGNITFAGTAATAQYTSTGTSRTTIGGNFSSGGTLTTSGTGTFNFNGAAPQTIGAYTTYNNVEINNTSGDVTLAATNTTFGGTLAVNAGILDIGGFNFTVTGTTTINSTLRISSTAGTKTFHDITISNGGILNFTAAEIITHLGSLTVNGTGAITGTTGVWAFQQAGGGTISGTASSIAITSATFTTSYIVSIPTTFSGTVTVTGIGVVFTNNSTITVTTALSGTGQLTQGTNSVLNIGGTSAITALDASASPNEVHYTSTAANQTIKAVTSAYHSIFIEKSGRVGTLTAATTINGNLSVAGGALADGGFQITGNASGILSVASGASLTLGTAAASTSFPTGFTTINISLDPASTINYNSNLAQTISNAQSYGNLTLTTAAVVTKTIAGQVIVNGTLNVGVNNTLADAGNTITAKGNVVMTGTYTGTDTLVLTGSSAGHTLTGGGSYANLKLDDSNGATQSAILTVTGALTLSNGIFSAGAFALTVNGLTTIESGTALSITSATGAKKISDLTVNGTGMVTGATGILTFQKPGGGTISGTALALSVAGSSVFTTDYALPLPFTTSGLTVTGATVTNAVSSTVNGTLGGTGTFTQNAGTTLNVRSVTITTLNATAAGNSVHYIGGVAGTIKSTSYVDLDINKSTGFIASASGTVNVVGNLTVTAGTLNFSSSIFTVVGTTDIYGTLTDSSGGPAGGNNFFEGAVTVYPGAHWTAVVGEVCDFHFKNGLAMNGASFVSAGGDYIFETNNQSITGSSAFTIQKLTVNGIQLTNSSLGGLTISSALSGTGEFIQDVGAALNISGTSVITTLTATASGNSISYNGSTAQTVKATVYRTLDVSNNVTNSVTITADTSVNTALVLGTSILSTDSSIVSLGAGATLSRISGFVNGNLQKNISIGSPSQTFEVGSGTDYAPVVLTFHTVTVSGGILMSTVGSDHADIATSHLIIGKTANRFYGIINNGVSFDTYDAAFTFVPTDVDVGANSLNFVLAKFNSGAWSRPMIGTVTPTSISATGLLSVGDFQIGESDVVSTILVDTVHANGSFGAGEIFDITVHYDSVVVVAGGTPSLSLNTGGTALYISGSGTDTLTFRNSALSGEYSADLDYMSVGSLSLNGATIKNTGGGDTDNTLPSVGTFAGAHAIVVGTPPPATLHIFKHVVNTSGGTAITTDFNLHVKLAGSDVAGSPAAGVGAPGIAYLLAANTYLVSEDPNAGYNSNFSGDCDSSGNVTLASGDDKACTITNTDIPPVPATLHVIKLVVNGSGGTAIASDFTLHVTYAGIDVAGSPAAGTTTPGTAYSLSLGTYVISEDADVLYTQSFSGDCDSSGSVTLVSADDKTCIITNTDIALPASSDRGGGGGLPTTSITFSGQAYRSITIALLRKSIQDDQYHAAPTQSVVINDDGTFEVSQAGLPSGEYFYALQIKDKDGRKTIMSFEVNFLNQTNYYVGNIFVPPTLGLVKTLVAQGDDVRLEGYGAPNTVIEVDVDGTIQKETVFSDEDGYYTLAKSATPVSVGTHYIKVRQVDADGRKSDFSVTRAFKKSLQTVLRADLNRDGAVNITDWSIFIFRWVSQDQTVRSTIDLDDNGIINIFDLSVFLKSIEL